MKTKTLITGSAALLLTIGLSAPVFADDDNRQRGYGYEQGGHHERNGHSERGERRERGEQHSRGGRFERYDAAGRRHEGRRNERRENHAYDY